MYVCVSDLDRKVFTVDDNNKIHVLNLGVDTFRNIQRNIYQRVKYESSFDKKDNMYTSFFDSRSILLLNRYFVLYSKSPTYHRSNYLPCVKQIGKDIKLRRVYTSHRTTRFIDTTKRTMYKYM